MNELIINDVIIELLPNTVIAQTLKAVDIGDLVTRKFNFTNTLFVPHTPNNDLALGTSWIVESDSNIPYIKLSARIKVNGIETVSSGIAYIRSANGGYYVDIISGAKSFFSTIEGLRLSALTGFVLSNEDAARTARRNAGSGIVIPVGYYGEKISIGDVHVGGVFIYDKSILDEIVANAGYTYSGNFLGSPRFAIQATSALGNIKGYVDSFVDARRAEAYVSTPQPGVLTNGGGGSSVEIQFTGVNKAGLFPTGYWDGISKYINDDSRIPALKSLFDVTYKITVNITVPVGSTVNVMGYTNVGSGTYSVDYINDPSSTPNGGFLGNGVANGLRVVIVYNSSPGFIPIPFTINSGSIIIQPQRLTRYTFPATGTGSGIDRYTDYAGLLPDIEQKEFIRNIMMQYSLIPSEENGELLFTSIEEIISAKSTAPDWTSKRVSELANINFIPQSYAQINKFAYSNVDENVTEDYGAGNFTINNSNITLTKDIFRSVFSASQGSVKNNLLVAYIPLYNNEAITSPSLFNLEPGYRNVLLRSKQADEPNVTYPDGASYSDYLAIYFDDPSNSISLRYQQLLDENYDLLVSSLQKAKLVQGRYLLNETDLASFKFLTPIFDTNSYYLVNEIKEFISGKASLVDLFKIL